jgi:hypothetical protein
MGCIGTKEGKLQSRHDFPWVVLAFCGPILWVHSASIERFLFLFSPEAPGGAVCTRMRFWLSTCAQLLQGLRVQVWESMEKHGLPHTFEALGFRARWLSAQKPCKHSQQKVMPLAQPERKASHITEEQKQSVHEGGLGPAVICSTGDVGESMHATGTPPG